MQIRTLAASVAGVEVRTKVVRPEALTVDRPKLSPADRQMLMQAERNNHMSE